MEKITRTLVGPDGVDNNGNVRHIIGFDKTTFPFPTFWGGNIIPKREISPPSSRVNPKPIENSKT